MPKIPDSNRRGPPHNPGLYQLVSGKRQWSATLSDQEIKRGFRGWHERGYLPHRDEAGLIQFVTFHLADSFPSALRSEWEAMLAVEDNRERRLRFEKYLDQGRGKCWLRHENIAKLVEKAFRFHHSHWYYMHAWVVMPNHVHFLIEVIDTPLSKIIKELKRHSGRQANKILNRTGAFWCEDYFDIYMRDSKHQLRTRHYIENNPVKARLVRDVRDWPWSSARFRDKNGNFLK
jgi:REP element-mobilizing transposase RayT